MNYGSKLNVVGEFKDEFTQVFGLFLLVLLKLNINNDYLLNETTISIVWHRFDENRKINSSVRFHASERDVEQQSPSLCRCSLRLKI